MDTLTATLWGAARGAPYQGPLLCRGCGSHIGMYDREGQLVGMEYHQARVVEDNAELIGWGSSGFGMWRVSRRWSCLGKGR